VTEDLAQLTFVLKNSLHLFASSLDVSAAAVVVLWRFD
jgi:hypothetical protein